MWMCHHEKRPANEFFGSNYFVAPANFEDAKTRLIKNLPYFASNYGLILLVLMSLAM